MFTVLNTTAAVLGNFILVTASFLILLVLIRGFAWDAITGIFEKRAETIANDLDEAADKNQAAEELVKQREKELTEGRVEAKRIVEDAIERGKIEKKHLVEQANLEVTTLKEKAQLEIAAEQREAQETLRVQVAQLAVDLAGKIILEDLGEKAHSDLIDRYIDKLGDK
ncbi:F0F1 ATP synthase subunit B [Streptococcus gallinaceus]|uniref:ATP synthase subunit b n=1 Tax=Streptococcus gallinaceus TaxID=165758 RepID=A0ABV2JIH8_9STRE